METLAERIERDGPLNELDAVGWIIRLAKRLEALHALGVAHGSVTTTCVQTEAASRTSRGVLVDVSRAQGSLAFHSPERVRAGAISPADDAWALGVTLYTLLTGSPPFSGGSDDELKQRILTGAAAPLAVFDVGDDDLQRILDDVLARDSGQRTTRVKVLRAELEKWHPDPTVKDLSAIDDEDATDDGEGSTMPSKAPAADRVVVRTGDPDFDDDDDDARTVLRDALKPSDMEAAPAVEDKPAWAPTGPRRPAKPLPPVAPPPPRPPPPPPPSRTGDKGLPKPNESLPPEDNAPTKVVTASAMVREMARRPDDDDDDDENIRTVLRPALGLEVMAPRSAPLPAAGRIAPPSAAKQAWTAPMPASSDGTTDRLSPSQGGPASPPSSTASPGQPVTAAGTVMLSPEEQQAVAGALPVAPPSSGRLGPPADLMSGLAEVAPFSAPGSPQAPSPFVAPAPSSELAPVAPEPRGSGLKLVLLLVLLLVATIVVTFLFLQFRPV